MRLFIAALLGAYAVSAGAQMYRWTDAAGRVHFTGTPPPASAKDVKLQSTPTGTPPNQSPEPFAVQHARNAFPVKFYSMPGCEACDEARKLLNARGVPFSEVSVTVAAQIEELKQAVGSNSVPALIVGRSVQKGFEAGAYHGLLDGAGYPKTGILPPRQQVAPVPSKLEALPVEPAAPAAPAGPYAPAEER